MKSDFTPVIREFKGDIKIYPLFDAHIGAEEFDEKMFSAFSQDVLSQDNAYVVVGGDILNNGTKSSVTNVYGEKLRPREQKEKARELLTPLRERILCGVPGNHEWRSVKEVDDDPLYDVFCKMDLEDCYRENAVFLLVRCLHKEETDGRRVAYKSRPAYSIVVSHGAGGGTLLGSGLNRAGKFADKIDGVDLYISGHTHKPGAAPDSKIVIDPRNGKVTRKQFGVVKATSWLEYGGYPLRGQLPPTASVWQQVHLSSHGKRITVSQRW